MRITKCDVCGEEYGRDEDMIEMVIPASFLEDEGESIRVDACTWNCVGNVVDSALKTIGLDENQPEQSDQPAQPEERFIAVPKVPSIDVDMDQDTLAKFTEQVTGVKRR